jgi:MFS family permease
MIVSALIYGVGFGAGPPPLMAMTTDRVPVAERGRAMGTFFVAWELGIFGGSVLMGVLAASFGYVAMWWIAAGVAWAGALIASRHISRPRG